MNRLVEETLRHYVNARQTNWPALLPMAEFAINNAYSSAIQSTPFFLMYGQHPNIPAAPPMLEQPMTRSAAHTFVEQRRLELAAAREALDVAQQRMRSRYTRTPELYEVGQHVLLSARNLAHSKALTGKLLPKWVGPFPILECISKLGAVVAVKLELPKPWKVHNVFSVCMVKPYKADQYNADPGTDPTLVYPAVEALDV
jgi:hypothetical protein